MNRLVTRRHARVTVSFPVMLVHKDHFQHQGTVLDLSIKGCRVKSTVQAFTGMQLGVLLHVPGNTIAVQNAAVRWSGSHGMGIEFLAIGAADQERLNCVLQNLEGSTPGKSRG